MKVVNLTPHAVSVLSTTGAIVAFPPSGEVARVATRLKREEPIILESKEEEGEWPKFDCASRELGEVTGLPEVAPDETYYIVSTMVLDALVTSDDLRAGACLVPDSGPDAIRDEKGQIAAVRRFIVPAI